MPRSPKRRSPKSAKKAAKKPVKKARPKLVGRAKRLFKKAAPKRVKSPSDGASLVFSGAQEDTRLPRHYGEDKLTLLVRDPWWLFAFWEVTAKKSEETAQKARRAGHRRWKTVLRVYDVTQDGAARPGSFFDIELNFFTDNWYVDVGMPDHRWMVELGLRADNGDFFPMVRSNIVGTPSFGLSSVLDEEWMLPEDVFLKIVGLTGPGGQAGSEDIRKMLEKYLKRVVSSESSPRAPLTR